MQKSDSHATTAKDTVVSFPDPTLEEVGSGDEPKDTVVSLWSHAYVIEVPLVHGSVAISNFLLLLYS